MNDEELPSEPIAFLKQVVRRLLDILEYAVEGLKGNPPLLAIVALALIVAIVAIVSLFWLKRPIFALGGVIVFGVVAVLAIVVIDGRNSSDES